MTASTPLSARAHLAPGLIKLIGRFELPVLPETTDRSMLPAFYRREFARSLRVFFRLAPKFSRRSQVEEIHDMRVMARRIDEYLELLAPVAPAALAMGSQDFLHRFMRILSPIRNADVSRGMLAETLKQDLSALEKDALVVLDKVLLKRRAKRLKPALALVTREDSQERFALLAQLGRAMARATAAQKDDFPPALGAHLHRRAAEALMRFEKEAALSTDADLHGLRICLRRLRYATEACRAACRRPAKREVAKIRRFQSILGAHHDLSVLVTRIGKESAKLKEGEPDTDRLKRGYERLAARYARLRDTQTRAFHRLAGAPPPVHREGAGGRAVTS